MTNDPGGARARTAHPDGALPPSTTVEAMTIRRTPVNPWSWSIQMGFNQGELVEGDQRTLYCAGQTAMSADGQPQHAGDMAAQVAMAVDNLEAVLGEAGMTLANVVRLNIYTTDVDEFFANYAPMAGADGGRRRVPTRHAARRRPARLPGADGRDRGNCGRLTGSGARE